MRQGLTLWSRSIPLGFMAAGFTGELRIGGVGRAARSTAVITRNTSVGVIERTQLPENVAASLENLESKNWKVNRPGVSNGKTYKNEEGGLPSGVRYKEYDVNPGNMRPNRDTERFVTGDNGKVYYTNNHYGQIPNGEPSFYEIQ